MGNKSKKASMETMGLLHGMVAQEFLEKLRSGTADSRDMAVMVKFLKDNEVSCDANLEPLMDAVEARLPDFSDEEYTGLKLVRKVV